MYAMDGETSSCGSIFVSCRTVRISGISVTVKRNSTVQVENVLHFVVQVQQVYT